MSANAATDVNGESKKTEKLREKLRKLFDAGKSNAGKLQSNGISDKIKPKNKNLKVNNKKINNLKENQEKLANITKKKGAVYCSNGKKEPTSITKKLTKKNGAVNVSKDKAKKTTIKIKKLAKETKKKNTINVSKDKKKLTVKTVEKPKKVAQKKVEVAKKIKNKITETNTTKNDLNMNNIAKKSVKEPTAKNVKVPTKRATTTETQMPEQKRAKTQEVDCQTALENTNLSSDDDDDDEDYEIDSAEELECSIIDDYFDEVMNEDSLFDFNSYENEDEEDEEEEEEEEVEVEQEEDKEEEKEHYFDFDYGEEEEDDTYSYTDDRYDEHFSCAYEDIIIHEGTAIQRPLDETDGPVEFDVNDKGIQIIELTTNEVKVFKQPLECDRELLVQMSAVENNFTTFIQVDDESECPDLVSIIAGEATYLQNDVAGDNFDSGEYLECTNSDNWSFVEEEISAKYQNEEELVYNMPVEMHVRIENASGNIDEIPAQFVDDTTMVEDEEKQWSTEANNLSETQAVIVTAELNENDEEVPSNAELQQPIDDNMKSETIKKMSTRFFMPLMNNYVLALLEDEIYFYGTLRFKLIAGAAEIYGYQVPINEEFELFSTRGSSAISLRPLQTSDISAVDVEKILKKHNLNFDKGILFKILKEYKSNLHALVLMRRNDERQRLITHYKQFMQENIFPNMPEQKAKKQLQIIEQKLNCYINAQSPQALRVPYDWQQIPLSNNARIMLTGGNGVGKSTLLRYLLNRFLSVKKAKSVLLIDLDVGQGELSASQTVSCTLMCKPLLGPGFFLNQPPDVAYLVGDINVTTCIQRYLRAVRLLIQHCQAEPAYQRVPWLINTMGYNQGIGMELIAAICELLMPTDVVQIQSNKSVANFPKLLRPIELRSMLHEIDNSGSSNENISLPNYVIKDYRLHVLRAAIRQESRFQRDWNMSPKDFRYASLLAQISHVLLDEGSHFNTGKLCCVLLDNIKLMCLNDPHIGLKELQQALTANVIYLCRQAIDDETPMQCVGIGIVRSLDEQYIYVMPAAGEESMKNVDCIVISEQPLPTANFKCPGTRVKDTCLPFLYNSEGHASTAVKQIYRRPANFLTGNHRSLLAEI